MPNNKVLAFWRYWQIDCKPSINIVSRGFYFLHIFYFRVILSFVFLNWDYLGVYQRAFYIHHIFFAILRSLLQQLCQPVFAIHVKCYM